MSKDGEIEEIIKEIEKGTPSQRDKTYDMVNRFVRMAPDILDVVLASLGNPAAGIGLIANKIINQQRTSEARIQKVAEAQFYSKIKEFKDEYAKLIEQGELYKVAFYLSQEANNLAENAVKLNERELMDEVFAFYKKNQKLLLSSSSNNPLSLKQLAGIKTELGIVQLKVMWAESHRSALITQKLEDERELQNQLQEISIKENALQVRVFLLLLLYIGAIALSIIFGREVWASNYVIPWLGIPMSIVLWSAIGSLANMLYKYYKRKNLSDIKQELRWVWARPLVGIIMGAVTYLVLVSGLILAGASTPQNVNLEFKPEILWLFAFMGGFSDKIFEGVIEKIGLITVEKSNGTELQELLQALSKNAKEKGEEEVKNEDKNDSPSKSKS